MLTFNSFAQKPEVILTITPTEAEVGEPLVISVKSSIQGSIEIDNLPGSFTHGYGVMNGMEQEMDHNTGNVITRYYMSQPALYPLL